MSKAAIGRVVTFVLAAVIVLTAACGVSQAQSLKRGVELAKHRLMEAGRNPMAAMSLSSVEEQGGNVTHYIYASLPPKDPVFSSFDYRRPSRPWTVVIREGSAPREYIVEGYGEDLTKPLLVEQFTIGTPPRL